MSSSGRRVVRCGEVHLTIRLPDGTLTLTPEWMRYGYPRLPAAQESVRLRGFAWRGCAICAPIWMRF